MVIRPLDDPTTNYCVRYPVTNLKIWTKIVHGITQQPNNVFKYALLTVFAYLEPFGQNLTAVVRSVEVEMNTTLQAE